MSTDAAAQAGPETVSWGRVAEDGTVYVRTPEGERAVGSWQAGTPEQGLAFFTRRYDDLAIEVGLCERRLGTGAGDPAAVAATARRLRESLGTASVVGDLSALERRLVAVEEGVLRSYNYMPGGRRRDVVYYSILRDEWPAVRKDRFQEAGAGT